MDQNFAELVIQRIQSFDGQFYLAVVGPACPEGQFIHFEELLPRIQDDNKRGIGISFKLRCKRLITLFQIIGNLTDQIPVCRPAVVFDQKMHAV